MPAVAWTRRDGDALTGEVAAAGRRFDEEQRSRQPSLFSAKNA